MPLIIRLPDGQTASFPDGTDPAVANARLNADYPDMFGIAGKEELRRNRLIADGERKPDEYTTGDRFRKAFSDFESQSGEFRGLIEDRLGNPNEGAGIGRIAANRMQALDAENIAPPAMDYSEIDGIGSFGSFLGQNLIQSAPQMASSAVGAAGALATLPVSAPAALAAGLGAGALVNLPSYGGQNIDDQIQQLMAAGLTEQDALQRIQLGPAAVSGAAQATLDALPFATAVGKPLVSVGKPLLESIGKNVAASKIGQTAAGRIAGRAGMRAGETAVDEATAEALQQALTIGQSAYVTGDGIGDKLVERRGEIGDAAIAGGLIGGGLGGAGGVVFPNRPASEKKASPAPAQPTVPPADLSVGRRGKFVYDGQQYDGVITGFSEYGLPIFYSPDGTQRQVQPRDVVAMQEEQALLSAPSATLQAGAAGAGTESAYDSLRRQAGVQAAPLQPEERRPAAGAAYSGLQQQMAAYQQMEADRKAAQEDAVAKQREAQDREAIATKREAQDREAIATKREAQDREAIATKREQDLEAIADKQRATQYADAVTDIPTALPRLTYDNTLLADKTGTVAPRQVFADKAKEAKDAIAQRQEKRAADGFDATIEPPATVIDRAPLPPEPEPAAQQAPSVPQASPDFEAGPLVKGRHTDYTRPTQQQRRWIEGTVAELNDTSGGQRIFLDAEGQGGTQDVVGGKGNTPQWFSDYNKGAVRSQKARAKAGKKNTLTDDSQKKVLEPATQILTRKQVTDVANKLLEGKPLGKSEVKVAETIYAQAKSEREQNARQIEMRRTDRAEQRLEDSVDESEPTLPPRDTSLDDIPFDMPDNSTQRFKGEAAINRVAAERGAVTSKVIDRNGHYDPLTENNYFPEDAAVAPHALENKQKNKPKNNQWKKEKIEITLDDGSKQKVDAGAITGRLKKMANDLQKLKACLG